MLVVLAVVTVVGHVIWVVLEFIVRALFGVQAGWWRVELQRCPFCEHLTPGQPDRCECCGRDLGGQTALELSDLAAMERQLQRFQRKGALSAEEAEDLANRVQRYRRRLLEESRALATSEPAQSSAGPLPRPSEGPADEEIITPELVDESPEADAVPAPVTPSLQAAQQSAIPSGAATTPTQPATSLETPPPSQPPVPVAPKPPRKPWTELLASFLEERNIRWSELILVVAGLLIVGSSVALVISLWDTLEQIPVFKFLIFVAVSSMVFGIGLYAHYRWKLQSTGRGLLLIATLMVPLNFLAMASFSKDNWTLLNVAWEMVAVGIFVYLVGLAACVLVPKGRWFQVLGVVGNSLVVLLMARLPGIDTHTTAFVAAGALPVAVFAAAIGCFLYRTSDEEDMAPEGAGALFVLLGTVTFTLLISFGLLVARSARAEDGFTETLTRCSPLMALAALPILAAGLTVVRRMSRDVSLGAYRTAGTMIALVAVGVMLASLGAAWPQPLALLAVGSFNAATLVFVAFRFRLHVAHAGAIACGALVYLTGYHLLAGNLELVPQVASGRQMLELAARAESGAALIGLFLLLAAAAELLARWVDRRHAEQYAGGCAVVAIVSLLLVTVHGIITGGSQAPLATAVYGVYAIGSLLLNARFRRPILGYFGSVLLAGTTLWALWWQTGGVELHWATILAGEALAMCMAAAVLFRLSSHGPSETWNAPQLESDRNKLIDAYRIPLLHVAEVLAGVALVLGIWTAWVDRAVIHDTALPVVTVICVAAVCLLLAWGYRSVSRTWLGSMIVLAGLVHTLAANYTELLEQPLLDALLAHATIAVLAAGGLESSFLNRRWRPFVDDVNRVFVKPLGATALLSSGLALAVVAFISWEETATLAACLFWLAAIWLSIAWTRRWPLMFAAGEAVLTLAVAVATTAWLQQHPWVAGREVNLLDPRSLQAYGIGLGLLTLLWTLVRISLRRSSVARGLMDPQWPTVDRLVGHAVVMAQLLLAVFCLAPACWAELTQAFPGLAAASDQPAAFGSVGWILVGVLAAATIARLWNRWREEDLASGLLLAAVVPLLIAGQFVPEQAAASALRWGLAVALIVFSVAILNRVRLRGWCDSIGMTIDVGSNGPGLSRAVLLGTTVLPVLGLTITAAVLQITGIAPGNVGPAWDSFFARIGPEISYLVPLVLVMAALVGFAVRENSAGYAFSGGLVAKLSVTLGYVLGVVVGGGKIDAGVLATLLQLFTITAALWAIAWLIGRRWIDVWREAPPRKSAGRLMNLQLGLGATGMALLWLPAVVTLALMPTRWHDWTIAAGSWPGWFALISMAAAAAYRQIQTGRRLQPDAAGLAGLAALGLLACTVRGIPLISPDWGYRTLMLGWATYSLFIVLATWWVATIRTLPNAEGPPQVLIRTASLWVRAAGSLAVLLGIKAALFHRTPEDLLWAAAAIALASGAGAAMSVWRRREGWAFAAALGTNLAASLVVWHYRYDFPIHQWWILLVQANMIATSAVALVWLAARRRLYQLGEFSLGTSPLLAVQTTLAVAGNLLILILPVAELVTAPDHLPQWAGRLSEPPGWISLILTAAACGWYLRQISPRHLIHVLAGLGLAIAVLVTCHTALENGATLPGDWLSYHLLTTCCAAMGLIVLAVGWLGRDLRLLRQSPKGLSSSDAVAEPIFPGWSIVGWVTVIGTMAVVLALIHCLEDPSRPWWSARAIWAAALAAGLMAVWLRLPGYVWVSGLLLNLAGTLIWMAWEPWTYTGLLQVNVICLAVASGIWTLIRPICREGVPGITVGGRQIVFAHVAVQAALAGLGIWVVATAASNVLAFEHPTADSLGWASLLAVIIAAGLCFWDRSARFPLGALYLAGLTAVGMMLDARSLLPRVFCWTAAHELAAFVLLTAAAGWLLRWLKPAWRMLRIRETQRLVGENWFPDVQSMLAGLALVLSCWVSIDFGFDGIGRSDVAWIAGRMAGPLAAAGLLLTATLTAGLSSGNRRTGWQYAAFSIIALGLAQLTWAWFDQTWFAGEEASPWLHRNVVLMASAVATALLAGFTVKRILPAGSDWITAGRRMLPVLGAVALLLLLVVLVQEGLLYESPDGVPMAIWAVLIVVAVLAGLVIAVLAMALSPGLDPLGMSDRGRTAYVYAAEVIAVLVGVHLWATMPWLFRLGLIDKYWMLLVLIVAFGGAGLSELFQRRGLPVLSEPLRLTALMLPLAPAIGFWLPITPEGSGLAGASSAFWFLVALFYGFMATSKRSILLWAASMLSANIGLWILWNGWELRLWDRPQLFLIPVGISALIAEYLNYDRLTKAQSAGLRYLALSLIYVSSSTEFIRELGESWVLPIVLILLSVLGVLTGIVLRIRSFVYLGLTFLSLVILTMIWYAAVDQRHTWVLWVFCITLAAGIIALVGIFEKRRDEILTAMTRFRKWERRRIGEENDG